MPTITFRVTDDEAELIKAYAAQERRTLADTARTALIEQIEDHYDLLDLRLAKDRFSKNPVSYPIEDVMAEFGIPHE